MGGRLVPETGTLALSTPRSTPERGATPRSTGTAYRLANRNHSSFGNAMVVWCVASTSDSDIAITFLMTRVRSRVRPQIEIFCPSDPKVTAMDCYVYLKISLRRCGTGLRLNFWEL
jgi:hypothetical protein